MEQRGEEVHTTESEASAGSKENVVRWVLIVGTVLAIVLLTIIWITGAHNRDASGDQYVSVSNEQLDRKQEADEHSAPMAPTVNSTTTAEAKPANPMAGATPGDAPAGDPTNDAK